MSRHILIQLLRAAGSAVLASDPVLVWSDPPAGTPPDLTARSTHRGGRPGALDTSARAAADPA